MKAESYNKQAAIIIIRRMLKRVGRGGMVDLHGLEVRECIKFLDDYGEKVDVIVTGNSERIKPVVVEYYRGKGYVVNEDRVKLYIKKKIGNEKKK